MVSIPDGSFKDWQENDVIKASEYTQEREIIRTAINYNNLKLSTLESSTAVLQIGNAQLQKITDDAGGVKINVTSIIGDLLAELIKAGKGFHTFYAIGGSKNLPPSNISIRGIAHITGTNPSFGYVIAMDYKNKMYINYIDNNKWLGWDEVITAKTPQEVLWTGVMYPIESQSITPSKKLSDCRTGWLLVWSDMDAGIGPNDFNWSTTFVPKTFPDWAGTNFMASVPSYVSSNGLTSITVVKQLSITDTTITGNTTNDEGDVNDVVLRKVIEV